MKRNIGAAGDSQRQSPLTMRTDKQVTGAIELAYLRGVQAGAEKERSDIIACIRASYFGGSEEIVSMIKRRK